MKLIPSNELGRHRGGGEYRPRLSKQALRYALIVLPYGQHRASLRACLLNQETFSNLWGKIIVVDGQNA